MLPPLGPVPTRLPALNAAPAPSFLPGFHTVDYARHFLSCCSRMLGLEHKTSRGSIIVEYYGRDVGIKIMPTGKAGMEERREGGHTRCVGRWATGFCL